MYGGAFDHAIDDLKAEGFPFRCCRIRRGDAMTARALAAAALAAALTPAAATAIDFTNFHSPAQMDAELNALAAAHPGLAQVFTIGTTAEGRPIRGLKISDNVATDEPGEGDVVFVGLHHAREWISAELALYLAEYLVTHHGTDPALAACMNQLEVWIIPVMNPDGYAYSAAAPANRLWRKNRRNNGDGTFGVDLNRNYSLPVGSRLRERGIEFHVGGHVPRSLGFQRAGNPGAAGLRAGLAQSPLLRHVPQLQRAVPPPVGPHHGRPARENPPWPSSRRTASPASPRSTAIPIPRTSGTSPTARPRTSSGTRAASRASPRNCAPPRPAAAASFPAREIIPTSEENLAAALALIRDAGCRKVWIKDHAADTGVEPSAVWLGDHWSQAFWVSPDIWTDPVEARGGKPR